MIKKIFLVTLFPLIAVNGISASAPGSPLDRFTFDYMVQGDARAKPLQVFDDGQKTFIRSGCNFLSG